jgi:putative membrane protein
MIMMGIFAVVVVALIVLAVKRINSSSKRISGSAALDELKIKFAKGEITEEEYVRRKRILSE